MLEKYDWSICRISLKVTVFAIWNSLHSQYVAIVCHSYVTLTRVTLGSDKLKLKHSNLHYGRTNESECEGRGDVCHSYG